MSGDTLQTPSTRSFISSNISKALDFCNHPSYLNLHSLTSNYGLGPAPVDFWPVFSMCKTSLFSDIVVTPLEQYDPSNRPQDPMWEDKTQDRMLWRGSTTGSRYDRFTLWRPSQRTRLNHRQSFTTYFFESGNLTLSNVQSQTSSRVHERSVWLLTPGQTTVKY